MSNGVQGDQDLLDISGAAQKYFVQNLYNTSGEVCAFKVCDSDNNTIAWKDRFDDAEKAASLANGHAALTASFQVIFHMMNDGAEMRKKLNECWAWIEQLKP